MWGPSWTCSRSWRRRCPGSRSPGRVRGPPPVLRPVRLPASLRHKPVGEEVAKGRVGLAVRDAAPGAIEVLHQHLRRLAPVGDQAAKDFPLERVEADRLMAGALWDRRGSYSRRIPDRLKEPTSVAVGLAAGIWASCEATSAARRAFSTAARSRRRSRSSSRWSSVWRTARSLAISPPRSRATLSSPRAIRCRTACDCLTPVIWIVGSRRIHLMIPSISPRRSGVRRTEVRQPAESVEGFAICQTLSARCPVEERTRSSLVLH